MGRLVYRTIVDPRSGFLNPTSAAIYRDEVSPPEINGRATCAGKSKLRYFMAVNQAAFGYSHFFYDFLGMARAHAGLPQLGRRPFACFVHGIEAWPGPWARADRITVGRRATTLIANSQFTVNRASELDSTFARAKVCWLATEDDEPPQINRNQNGPPRVLIIGRLEEGLKGHQELMRCWPRVVAAVPDAVLTIVGRGPRMNEFQRLAVESGVPDKIEFRGFVAEADLPQLWAQSTVFAMPGRGEGFGLTYIEAMRYGVPVIASIHDAGSEVNVDGVTGYNVSLDNSDELPERLIQLLGNRDHAAALGSAGYQRWHQNFRFSAFRERFTPLLKEFLAQ